MLLRREDVLDIGNVGREAAHRDELSLAAAKLAARTNTSPSLVMDEKAAILGRNAFVQIFSN